MNLRSFLSYARSRDVGAQFIAPTLGCLRWWRSRWHIRLLRCVGGWGGGRNSLRPYIMSMLFLLLLTACSGNTNTPTGNGTPTPRSGTGNATATSIFVPPGVKLGSQPCPDAVKDPAHWDGIIGTQSGVSQVGRVTCGNLIGNPSLQALILVGYMGTGHIADVYVYNSITDASPHQLFKLQNLYKGNAQISNYNTVLTAEVDQNSKVNKGQPNAALQEDLFREFKWSDSVGTLVQIAFPGMFPDLTRFQAETDQAGVNNGQDQWKKDAGQVTNHMATQLLGWSGTIQTTVVNGGGANDAAATIQLHGPTSAAAASMTMTLNRLEGNTNGGIWEVINVTTGNASITSPVPHDRITSPVTITGKGLAFEGVIGPVRILDHLYSQIGQATAHGATGNGTTTFSTNVSYTSSFTTGSQEGLIVLSWSNPAGGPPLATVVKVMM